MLTFGDSKTSGSGGYYQPTLVDSLNHSVRADLNVSTSTGLGMLARAGSTVAQWAGWITTDLANSTGTPTAILVNIGSNDATALPAEATWKANLATVLDAMHAKWSGATVYVMRPWRRGYGSECNSMATWIADVLSGRSAWAFAGPDERVFLENGDNGATYTSDGIHPNVAGYALTATQWQTAMGY